MLRLTFNLFFLSGLFRVLLPHLVCVPSSVLFCVLSPGPLCVLFPGPLRIPLTCLFCVLSSGLVCFPSSSPFCDMCMRLLLEPVVVDISPTLSYA